MGREVSREDIQYDVECSIRVEVKVSDQPYNTLPSWTSPSLDC